MFERRAMGEVRPVGTLGLERLTGQLERVRTTSTASAVVAAIELDDRSHATPERIDADIKKSRAADSAGIRLVRWNVKGLQDDKDIRDAFVPG